MKKRQPKPKAGGESPPPDHPPDPSDEPYRRAGEPGTTGRYLVLFRDDAIEEGSRLLQRVTGLEMLHTAETGAVEAEQLERAGAIVFDTLGIAVVTLEAEQLRTLQAAVGPDRAILAIEPERIVSALAGPGKSRTKTPAVTIHPEGRSDPGDESEATWGLQATRVLKSKFSGQGIKVAVLDTGIDLQHPEFAGREIVTKSFIPQQDIQDKLGHGTHCIGTACGPLHPGSLPRYGRYGIAYGATIYAGKVLRNQDGTGTDAGILAGMEWAIQEGCRIISMSLGGAAQPGEPYSRVFEKVAQRAMAAGTVIVAAAGNESARRKGRTAPVDHPANCPSILAIAALDWNLDVAHFSNAGINPDGGQIDIAAPGVRVHSTWPGRRKFMRLTGTSMATPHVAGILALLAEAYPQASAMELVNLLTKTARRLQLPPVDIGAGLVQAPQGS